MRALCVVAFVLTLAVGRADAQAAAQPPAAPVQAAPAGQPPAAPPAAKLPAAPVEDYVYDPAGRRDPFVNLLGTGTDLRAPKSRTEGPAGMTAAEITVSGVVESRGSLVAMITWPDKKTYIVHAGERLLDGTIKAITAQGLVIVQEVNDPLSLVKQREIRKLLRSIEDAKE